jgi:glutathione synthase/RimK-type ligase-like ATP-grasp enzyme
VIVVNNMEVLQVKKIGVFSIREQFAYDLLQKINNLKKDDVRAEFAMVGETRFMEKTPYRVIIDRVSSHVSYYNTHFINAALTGTYVINNPLAVESVDRFSNYCQAKNLGLAVPRTISLPTRQYHPDCSSQDLGNLQYPLRWEEIGDFIGFPAILKPYNGYGFRDIYLVRNVNELIRCYDGTGRQTMIIQEYIPYDFVVKVFMVNGGKEIFVMKDIVSEKKYVNMKEKEIDSRISRVIDSVVEIADKTGLDFITTEIASKNDALYVYNFLNPFPDCREEILTEECYQWCLNKVAALSVEYAKSSITNPCQVSFKRQEVLEPQM